MRLAVLVLLVCSGVASARVVQVPSLRNTCPPVSPWDTMMKCIVQQGSATVARDAADTKLVVVPHGARFAGVYLFRHPNDAWQIVGEIRSEDLEVLAFEATDRAARVDVGVVFETTLDDDKTVTIKRSVMMVCPKADTICSEHVIACDVFSHGKAMWAFRGRPTRVGSKLHIVGDPSPLASICGVTPEDQDIPW